MASGTPARSGRAAIFAATFGNLVEWYDWGKPRSGRAHEALDVLADAGADLRCVTR